MTIKLAESAIFWKTEKSETTENTHNHSQIHHFHLSQPLALRMILWENQATNYSETASKTIQSTFSVYLAALITKFSC
jgi:hypothetical protein